MSLNNNDDGDNSSSFIMSDAWIRVQKSSFRHWANSQLKRLGDGERIEDVGRDFATGENLLKLVHAIYCTPLPKKIHKNPTLRHHKLDNVTQALRICESNGLKIPFLKAAHVVDNDVR